MNRPNLTELAQQAWLDHLRPGAWAVDATAGNGRDTAFLAGAAGPAGRVFAIDIQDAALRATAVRIGGLDLLERVTLVRGDHARLAELLPCKAMGAIDLVCFNLGYLPDGDHAVTTRPETTIPALRAALALLKPAGALSVIAYRGHPGGMREAQAVAGFFAALPAPWRLCQHLETGSAARPGPVWWLAAGAGGT